MTFAFSLLVAFLFSFSVKALFLFIGKEERETDRENLPSAGLLP